MNDTKEIEKYKLKNKIKGVTLIALMVTIIILLILAGITIATLMGNNDLIIRARDTKIATEIASIKEEIQTDILEEQVRNNGNISDDTLKSILEKYGVLSEEEKLIDKTLTTTKGNHKIKVADIFNGINVKDVQKNPTIADKSGASTPNFNKIAQKTYVTWTLNNEGTEYVINDTQTIQPDNWYDYENGKWANIKTTNEAEKLEAYWVWIPRYEYIEPTSTVATEIKVKFIPKSQKQPDEGYTIHPAFTNEGNGGFGDLDGIWVAKFEAVNNNSKVEVVPNETSWRSIKTNDIFAACRKMTNEGEVLVGSTIDSHMMKNIEWGAVAILSQSKYGVYNPESLNGEKGNKEYQVWNNPSNSFITGSVGNTKDADNQSNVNKYNSANGPKASTTGTVYGVYDMAGSGWEYVAGCTNGQENARFGVTDGNSQYVDLYTNSSNSYSNYEGAKKGDATKETNGWNGDYSYFVHLSAVVFLRGR